MQRPLPKSSRSDTHLPRLSRQVSNTSDASRTSHTSRTRERPRPRQNSRKQSGESVEIDDEGHEAGVVDEDEEGWESGEEANGSGGKGKNRQPADDPMSAAMRRTVSDTAATTASPHVEPERVADDSAIVDSPTPLPVDKRAPPSHITHLTRGFAGSVHTPDPAAQTPAHTLNDPTHIMPAHQIKHQASARSLHALATIEGDTSRKSSSRRLSSVRAESPLSATRTDSSRSAGEIAPGLRSASGTTGLPDTQVAKAKEAKEPKATSPSFPFPKVSPSQPLSSQPISTSPETAPPRAAEQADTAEAASNAPRSRQVSGRHPVIRHRPSNSSIRSVQSLRAPPHPLNSPTGYRTGIASTTATTMASPMKDKRGPSMHHPPIAPPVVYPEVAQGQGYLPESDEAVPILAAAAPSEVVGNGPAPKMPRTSSFSSARSLKGIFGPTRNDAASSAGSSQPPTPARRKTALELASAASRLHSTNDPVQYHQSLGHSSTVAETAHLISRFLPPKKIRRPSWEIHSQLTPEGYLNVGLQNGDYREAHESLIRTMKTLGVDTPSGVGSRRAMSRSVSHGYGYGHGTGLLGLGSGSGEENMGLLRGKNGPLVVSRGGWRGKTPFELSVERVMAQRPQRGLSGM